MLKLDVTDFAGGADAGQRTDGVGDEDLLLCLTACGSKMPYDLSGTAFALDSENCLQTMINVFIGQNRQFLRCTSI